MSFNCGQCGYYVVMKQACMITGSQVDAQTDTCGKFNKNPTRCELCETPLVLKFIDEGHVLCPQCCQAIRTCSGCSNGNECDFETNPSSLPKVILQTMNQGNMVMQTQVRNPERIEITCKNGCPCFDAENECLRQFNICGNYAYEWPEDKTNGVE